jgi:hypothetical protein
MQKILEAIAVTAELMGTQISPTAAAIMASDLSGYPKDAVIEALTRVRRESKSRLSLALVIEKIEQLIPDGRPSADEAWAMIPRDEYTSAVLTGEMLEAMGIAQPLLDEGDQVAARMAFKDAYSRLVDAAKRAGNPPEWFHSLGYDKTGREPVLIEAVRLGRLPASQVAGLLPAPEKLPMLALEDKRTVSPEVAKANLAKIRSMLVVKGIA